MDSSQIYQIIFAVLGIIGAFLTVSRLMEGAWVGALWPLLITGYCGWRLYTMQEQET